MKPWYSALIGLLIVASLGNILFAEQDKILSTSESVEPAWVKEAKMGQQSKKQGNELVFLSTVSSPILHNAIILVNFQLRKYIAEYMQKQVLSEISSVLEGSKESINRIIAQKAKLFYNFPAVTSLYYEYVQTSQYGRQYNLYSSVTIPVSLLAKYKNEALKDVKKNNP